MEAAEVFFCFVFFLQIEWFEDQLLWARGYCVVAVLATRWQSCSEHVLDLCMILVNDLKQPHLPLLQAHALQLSTAQHNVMFTAGPHALSLCAAVLEKDYQVPLETCRQLIFTQDVSFHLEVSSLSFHHISSHFPLQPPAVLPLLLNTKGKVFYVCIQYVYFIFFLSYCN